jgi:hypothetical protein
MESAYVHTGNPILSSWSPRSVGGHVSSERGKQRGILGTTKASSSPELSPVPCMYFVSPIHLMFAPPSLWLLLVSSKHHMIETEPTDAPSLRVALAPPPATTTSSAHCQPHNPPLIYLSSLLHMSSSDPCDKVDTDLDEVVHPLASDIATTATASSSQR